MPQAIISHPDAQHSYQLAVGLQTAGQLKYLLTRVYFSWQHTPLSWFRGLPTNIKKQIDSKIIKKYRRFHPDLDPNLVKTIETGRTLAILILNRLPFISLYKAADLLLSSSNSFQHEAAKLAELEGVKALVCYDRYAFEAFKSLEGKGIIKILDQSIAHPIFLRHMIETEKELQPKFAADMNIPGITDSSFNNVRQEAMMADYILAGSDFVKNSCIESGISAEKIIVLPYGVDISRFTYNPELQEQREQKPKFRSLFVGRIHQIKGISYLLGAFQGLSSNEYELFLCGNLGIDSDIVASFAQLNNIIFKGFVPHENLKHYYAESDVLVLPSLAEGFSQVILEAMACGLPVIASTNTGGEGVIENNKNGFIIPIRDPDAIREKIVYLKENPEHLSRMKLAARKTAEKYSWQRYHKQAAQEFESIFGKAGINSKIELNYEFK